MQQQRTVVTTWPVGLFTSLKPSNVGWHVLQKATGLVALEQPHF